MRSKPYRVREDARDWDWHAWFAWRPVTANAGSALRSLVWLETVERKWQEGMYYSPYSGSLGGWTYRLPK